MLKFLEPLMWMLLAKADVAKRLTKKYKEENASLLEKTKRGTWKLQISAKENYIEKLNQLLGYQKTSCE